MTLAVSAGAASTLPDSGVCCCRQANPECHLAHCSVPLLFINDRPMHVAKLIDVVLVVPFALRQLHVMTVVWSCTAQPLQLWK
jgi:hypothetical protein